MCHWSPYSCTRASSLAICNPQSSGSTIGCMHLIHWFWAPCVQCGAMLRVASTTYQAAWAFALMPLGACATQQFLGFVRRLPASAKDRVAKAGVSAFAGTLGMVAYICLSGLSCLWYVDNSRDYCSTRVYVCGTEILKCCFSGRAQFWSYFFLFSQCR